MPPAIALPDIDTVGLILISVFALMGAVRGLWWQVIRLFGLGASVFVARTMSPRIVPYLEEALDGPDPRMLAGAVYIVLFLLSLAAVASLGRLGRKVLEAAALGMVDRMGGLLAGALTGALLHAALVTALLQAGEKQWVSEVLGGSKSEALVEVLVAKLPLLLDYEAGREAAEIFGWPYKEQEPTPQPPTPLGLDSGQPAEGDAADSGQ